VSFKVIDVGTPGKLVSTACYDKQQVCVSAPFSRLMLTISYAGCLGLSPVISAQFALEMYVAAWNPFTFGIQGRSRSRSSMLVLLKSSSTVLVMISSKFICVYLQPFSVTLGELIAIK